MPTDVKLPRLGQGMESGVIVRWLKAEGDTVSSGDPLYELDTDKVTQEVEAEADGVLLKIVVSEGEVQVGSVVAVIGEEGESAAESPDGASARPADSTEETASEVDEGPEDDEQDGEQDEKGEKGVSAKGSDAPDAPPEEEETTDADDTASEETPQEDRSSLQTSAGRLKASPLARRMARERGIDLAAITGTGPDGRILAEDIERAASAPAASPTTKVPTGEVEVVELTSIRKTIARRLTEAWTAPVFQLGVTADMTLTLALRESLVERLEEGDAKPTVNDILVRLAASALTRHPAINATFTGEQIQRHPAANVGIAVAAPQGLIVPVIADAARRTVQEIARVRADLVGRARDGKLTMADLQGGTFTISNLGMFGVEQFTAVLNPPQVAILAVGSVQDQAVVRDGQVEVAPRMHLTLTCDHRAIDGADGAVFLQTLVALVERPALAL